MVSLKRVESSLQELLIILLNVSHTCNLKQVVSVVHLFAERFESINYLLSICNNRVVCARQLRKEMLLYLGVERELHLLWVYQYKLKL